MKKQTHKTKLRLQREALRTLQAHELRQVEGANALPNLPWTTDSKKACCA